MQLKKIEHKRCPWCGYVFNEANVIPQNKYEKYAALCENCRKWSCSSFWKGELFVIYVSCLLLFFILMFEKELWTIKYAIPSAVMPFLLYLILNATKIPLFRYIQSDTIFGKYTSSAYLGRASVRWYRVKEGGIGFPYLRLINNMIFPVCFVNAEGVPVSQTVCVRLQKRFLYFWRNAGVRLITEELWKADVDGKVPWEKAEKFLIFNCGEVIGEGRIK